MSYKIYRQKPVKGGREALPSCVIKSIKYEIEKLARQHRVSRSFVVATILADGLGIKLQERFDEIDR